MKILLTSDTHWGITKPKTIRKLFEAAAKEDFDVLIHAGDYCGTDQADKNVRSTVRIMREFIPDKPIVSVLGNHDYWTKQRSMASFHKNYDNIIKTFQNNNVHFLDAHGVYTHPDFPFINIVGHSGWYAYLNPPTNDQNFLPHSVEGHTNGWMLRNATTELETNLKQLDQIYSEEHSVVFVSHFPVVNTGNDYKGQWEKFSWSERVKEMMQEQYSCRYFLCGHAHQRHEGPERYEAGSDYCLPKYQIITVT